MGGAMGSKKLIIPRAGDCLMRPRGGPTYSGVGTKPTISSRCLLGSVKVEMDKDKYHREENIIYCVRQRKPVKLA